METRAVRTPPSGLPRIGTAVLAWLLLLVAYASTEPVKVRFPAGLLHGFLKLTTTDGTTIADGDLLQTVRGHQVTVRLAFRFKDGSRHDETTIFSQQDDLRLISYKLVQRGPSFPRPLQLSIDSDGLIVAEYADQHGHAKTAREHARAPEDLANGLILALLENARVDAPPKQFAFVVATPTPRVVTLNVEPPVEETFITGGTRRKAEHYTLKVDVGGLAGVIAPLVGKKPPDQHVWVLGGDAPAFIRSEQQFFADGPLWRIELVAPSWPAISR